jgi:citryl-CoA lyase
MRESPSEIRGIPLGDLIATASFIDAVFLLLRGDRPSANERAMLDAMLVACCDHGAEAPSTAAARVSASTGNALHVALAAGLLAMGPKHGCAVAPAMELLAREDAPEMIVCEAVAAGRRLPGFGHKVYTDHDPRAVALFARAHALGFHGAYVTRAQAVGEALAQAKGKRLPINIDGALAALLLQLHFSSAVGNAVFMLGRLPGLVAHAVAAGALPSYIRAGGADRSLDTGKAI